VGNEEGAEDVGARPFGPCRRRGWPRSAGRSRGGPRACGQLGRLRRARHGALALGLAAHRLARHEARACVAPAVARAAAGEARQGVGRRAAAVEMGGGVAAGDAYVRARGLLGGGGLGGLGGRVLASDILKLVGISSCLAGAEALGCSSSAMGAGRGCRGRGRLLVTRGARPEKMRHSPPSAEVAVSPRPGVFSSSICSCGPEQAGEGLSSCPGVRPRHTRPVTAEAALCGVRGAACASYAGRGPRGVPSQGRPRGQGPFPKPAVER
jgi:hypothetical protein